MSACPPDDVLAALLDTQITDDDATAHLRKHVDACQRCVEVLAALSHMRSFTILERAPSEEQALPGISDWTPPGRFDDFRIVRPLGRGGMGHVYLGQDVVLDRPVALKFVAANSPDPRALDRFYVEARAIARLQHPNVVSVYRIGDVDGRPYLAYELVPGEGLDRIKIPVGWQTALHVGLGIARGLAAAHRAGVLHRDIKPANVVLSVDGAVKLIDFGLAKLVGTERTAAEEITAQRKRSPTLDGLPLRDAIAGMEDLDGEQVDSGLTEARVLLGTPLYFAPELWSGSANATPRSDVYALGLVLYQLCSGRLQHADCSLRELSVLLPTLELPLLRSLRPAVPEIVADAIDRCVRRLPEERFASAEDVRLALEAADAFCRAFRTTSIGAPEIDVTRINESFARLAPRAEKLVARFYERLFELMPSLRALFPTDLTQQRMKLAAALQLVVYGLRRPERLIPMLEDLGRKHAPFNIETSHFDAFGRALLDALAEQEGPAWTPETERAWARAYAHIAGMMRRGFEDARAFSAPTERVVTPVEDVPRTRYAHRAGAALAYQILGEGPVDLVVVSGGVTHLELTWQHAAPTRFWKALAAFSRLILIDQRGTGMSERDTEDAALEPRMEDLRELLKEAGAARPVLLGVGAGSAVSALFTAVYPDQIRALILYGGAAQGAGDGLLGPIEREIQIRWGEPLFLEQQAPSLANDPSFRRWWASYLRLAATPSAAIDLLRRDATFDIRWVLPSICVPTLVLHRSGDRAVTSAMSRDLADRIPGARHVELSGDDHLPFVGDIEPLVLEVRRFLQSNSG
jgi:serine/threonine protein kinase/pimeloyl-ACP methyl ester carboxylesterase